MEGRHGRSVRVRVMGHAVASRGVNAGGGECEMRWTREDV
jgi:hypothetical protein